MIVGRRLNIDQLNSFEAPTLLIDIDIIHIYIYIYHGNPTTHGNLKEFYTPNIWVLT